jgi:catechol 2,3-dioxygenase-like lactoylglutathione lyase family enzyme
VDTDATYYGEPCDARSKIYGYNIGKIQFELLEPIEEGSTWNDYLNKTGDGGIHHIAFFVPKTEPAAKSFVEHGYAISQQGEYTGRTGMYTYLDTEDDLKTTIELLEHYAGSPVMDEPPMSSDNGIGTDIVRQVGIIVADIETTAQKYVDVLGLPKPEIFATAGFDVTETTYNGEPSEATAKLAFFNTGQIQIELIQPDEKPSVWREFLESKGEGAQHIAFQVEDTQKAVDHFAKFGIEVSQQGLYSDRSGIYTYMRSEEKLGTVIELLQNFK